MALNKAASASSTEDNRTDLRPGLANDGNSSTRWSSSYADGQWWEVDLGSVRQIDRVELTWETAYASRYRIRTRRSSGNSWSTVATVTNSSTGVRVHTFPARNTRYVRIQGDQRATRWGISLWDVRVYGPTSSPSPPDGDGDGVPDLTDQCPSQPGPASNGGCPTSDPPPPPTGQVELTPVDGGLNYFGQYTNGQEWTSPSHFTIGSWFRPANDQRQIARYRDFGLNTLIGVENPEGAQEALIRQAGLKTIIQSGERTRFNDLGSENLGWNGGDEIDMTGGGEFKCLDGRFRQSLAAGGIGANGINGDNKLVHVNYGKGLTIWYREGFRTDAQNECYVNHPWVDLLSVDTYYLTDQATGQWRRFGYSYGTDIEQLRRWDATDGQRKPMFLFVELGPPGFGETFAPQPAEVRSAVWHSIIAGARGVAYFDHNFGTDGGVRHPSTIVDGGYPQIYDMAKAVNAQIRALAPVLNSQTVTSGHSLSGATTRRLVKWNAGEGKFYVFLGTHQGGNATFSMPCAGNATAVRLAPSNLPGEAASIPVSNGSFTDSFADKNTIHIYRIDGGSTCGLP
jgi:hypothetical protein